MIANEDIFWRMQKHSQGDMIWKKMMDLMRKLTFSGVSITRLVDRCPRRHF